ncbi:hypothetical protein V1511DRAFT_524245 [Dipodascopsis uninucleata]
MTSFVSISLILIALIASVRAHSWIDVLYATDPLDGNIISTGYIRNYQGHYDDAETYELLNPTLSTSLCKADQQTPAYSTEYPMLTARPGDNITAQYDENGHVTVDRLAPDYKPHPGHYVWLWAHEPGAQLTTVQDMLNVSNVFAGPFNFDDGRCAVSDNNIYGRTAQPCRGTFFLPDSIAPGVYNIVWAWHFPKIPACEPGAPQEFYTSCLDINIIE